MNPSPDRGPDAPAEAPPAFLTPRQVLLLVLVTLLAGALRMYHLGSWSVWVDEAHTWRDITTPLSLFWEREGASNYPISYLLGRSVVDWFGAHDPGMLRMPFAWVGIATVPLLGVLAIPLVGSRAALLAALFLAVNPWHIYWSQNARAYVLLTFFGTIASVACFHAVRRLSWIHSVVAVAAAVIAGLCHPSAFLLLGTFLLYLLGTCLGCVLVGKRELPRLSRWGMGLAVVLLVLVPYLLAHAIDILQTFARSKPDGSLLHLVQTTAFYFRPALILVASGAAALAIRKRDRAGMFLILWAAVPLLLVAVVGVQVTARYAFISLPAVLLLASSLSLRIAETLQSLGNPLVRWILAILLVADMASYDYFYFTSQHGDRPRWREAVEYVGSQTRDPLILTTNGPTMNYYLRPDHYRGGDPGPPPIYSIVDFEIEQKGGGAAFVMSILAEAERQKRTLFVLVTEPELKEQDRDDTVAEYLRQHLREVARFPNWVGPKDQTVTVYR